MAASNPMQGGRKINHNGTVDIVCCDCGQKIVGSQPYRGFSTVRCVLCQKIRDNPDYVPPEVVVEDNQQHVVEQLGAAGFKAVGFRKRTEELLERVSNRITKTRRRITRD